MTLLKIVNDILEVGRRQPNINYVGNGDVYTLNSMSNVEYGVFYVTQSNHSISEDTVTYNLTLYYIDRVLNDKSNTLQVQSQGILVLNNIINQYNQIADVEIDYNINFTTFTHKFVDDCAGVFCNVKITTNNEIGICNY